MKILTFTLAAALAALQVPASAQAGDDSGHVPRDDPSDVRQTAFGRQGHPERVTRTVEPDISDDMRFTPTPLTVRHGETVKFVEAGMVGKVVVQ